MRFIVVSSDPEVQEAAKEGFHPSDETLTFKDWQQALEAAEGADLDGEGRLIDASLNNGSGRRHRSRHNCVCRFQSHSTRQWRTWKDPEGMLMRPAHAVLARLAGIGDGGDRCPGQARAGHCGRSGRLTDSEDGHPRVSV